MQILEVGIVADLGGEGITVHLRHLDVRNDQGYLILDGTVLGHLQQHVERFPSILGQHALHPDSLKCPLNLLARHRRVVRNQHGTPVRIALHACFHQFGGHLGGDRRDLVENALHVQDLHQLTIYLGHRRHVVDATCPFGWRQDGLPVHVDDALDRVDQEPLNGAVVLGDDDEALGEVLDGALAHRHAEIDHRDGLATDMCHAANAGVELGHDGQRGTLQHLAYLEYVDAKSLTSIETKQQQLQPVLSH